MQPGLLSNFDRPTQGLPVRADLHGAVYDILNAGKGGHYGQKALRTDSKLIRITGVCDGTLDASIAGSSPPANYVPSNSQAYYKWIEVVWNPTTGQYEDLSTSSGDSRYRASVDYKFVGFAKALSGFCPLNAIVRAHRRSSPTEADYWEFDGPKFMWAQITGFTVVQTDVQWKYNWKEMSRDASANGWSVLSGGRTDASTGCQTAWNSIEAYNQPGAYIQGNGADFGSAPFGTTTGTISPKLQPARGMPVVKMTWDWTNPAGGSGGSGSGSPDSAPLAFSFEYFNMIQQPCNP